MQLRVDFENVKTEDVFFWVLKSHVNLICGVVSRDYFLLVCLFVCWNCQTFVYRQGS